MNSNLEFWLYIFVMSVAIILYLGIGYIFVMYYTKRIFGANIEKLSAFGKIAAGGWSIMTKYKISYLASPVVFLLDILLEFIFWPIFILAVIATWLAYGIYLLFYG